MWNRSIIYTNMTVNCIFPTTVLREQSRSKGQVKNNLIIWLNFEGNFYLKCFRP